MLANFGKCRRSDDLAPVRPADSDCGAAGGLPDTHGFGHQVGADSGGFLRGGIDSNVDMHVSVALVLDRLDDALDLDARLERLEASRRVHALLQCRIALRLHGWERRGRYGLGFGCGRRWPGGSRWGRLRVVGAAYKASPQDDADDDGGGVSQNEPPRLLAIALSSAACAVAASANGPRTLNALLSSNSITMNHWVPS